LISKDGTNFFNFQSKAPAKVRKYHQVLYIEAECHTRQHVMTWANMFSRDGFILNRQRNFGAAQKKYIKRRINQ